MIETYLYNKEKENIVQFRDTFIHALNKNNERVYEILRYMQTFVKKTVNNNLRIEYSQIVEWPSGSYQQLHTDDPANLNFTTIIYLNDDFLSGTTSINKIEITPKKRRMIGFNGVEYLHSVKKITNGTRYTIATWFTDLQTNFVSKEIRQI